MIRERLIFYAECEVLGYHGEKLNCSPIGPFNYEDEARNALYFHHKSHGDLWREN